MAEIAIPMAVLGVMYIISNKEKKEGFANKSLPNVDRPVVNWPSERNNNTREGIDVVPLVYGQRKTCNRPSDLRSYENSRTPS